MKVVIIGSGNVASALGYKALEAGHRIVQVAGRNNLDVLNLANAWRSDCTIHWESVDKAADIYIVALSDSALPGLGKVLSLPEKLVVHTAGALPVDVLRDVSLHAGVLYPLQSFSSYALSPRKFPLLIDAALPEDLPVIQDFAASISRKVVVAKDAARLKLHVAAVVVNNFTNHLYTLAADFCDRENVDFNLLLPLISETVRRVKGIHPGEVQTGPAKRGDKITLERHRTLLSNHHDLNRLYDLFTILIEEYFRSDGHEKQPLE
jgi:predicted short-subunit dehydrogenase-like oxidoreductase (DUF2520 family)